MGKVAFVFSGQGDQYPGMGEALYSQYAAAKEVFDMCEQLRPGTQTQCFNGSKEELMETKNTQPCLFAMELAAAKVAISKGVIPDVLGGFSLGEMVAATVSGIFTDEEGFKLICKRAELMQIEAEKFDTGMLAVVRLDEKKLAEACEKYSQVYAVNFNCPGQTVVAGAKKQLGEFAEFVKSQGGRTIPLKVGGAFHSPFMGEASKAFREELQKAQLGSANIKMYSNYTAREYDGDVAELLSKQIANPVLWETLIKNMINEGVDSFVEIGPGRTLSNLIKKINEDVEIKTIEELLKELEK